ncbi:Nramp family divalent metal transporter [Paludisphaera mucosa]|uniref:Nramp family divalent metal transporter n=1 Tax=Paludisphaera mucosa TaxID=3030827 RepID=A0ABT6F3P3_9BACT|nr:Nramp family divalent metal transporter [Paludisphaera mucosa]MDG3002196.1 Nramp family divalent metal transporter [Paludisphaera mucosa]
MSEHAPEEHDLYATPADAVEEPPRTLRKALGRIGPGLILAAAIVGTGELINTTGLGAKAGFTLLWLILASCVVKVFVQVELGRYAIVHGKTTLAAFDTLPGPRAGASWICWLWLFMMLATQAQIAAMEGTVGQAAHMAFPGASDAMASAVGSVSPSWGAFLKTREEYIWAALTTLAASALLLSGGYRRIERITTILVAAVTLYTVASVAVLQWTRFRIGFPDVASGFTLALPATAVGLAFSAFGITGVGAAELVAYPYWCIEKGYARFVGPRPRGDDSGWVDRARGWTRVMQLDAWVSMLVFTIATVAFYLLGAAVLHPQGLDPKGPEMIPTLARMYLGPLEGTPLEPLRGGVRIAFLLGAWAVLFKTLYVATAANARLTVDFLNLTGLWRPAGDAGRERAIKVFCVVYPALALALYYAVREPLGLVKAGGVAQGMMLPLIAGATIYLRRRDDDPRVGPSRLSDACTWIAFVAITIVAGYSAFDLARSLLAS